MKICFFRVHSGGKEYTDAEIKMIETRPYQQIFAIAGRGNPEALRAVNREKYTLLNGIFIPYLHYTNEVVMINISSYNETIINSTHRAASDKEKDKHIKLLKEYNFPEMIENWHQVHIKDLNNEDNARDVIFNTYKDFHFPLKKGFSILLSSRLDDEARNRVANEV